MHSLKPTGSHQQENLYFWPSFCRVGRVKLSPYVVNASSTADCLISIAANSALPMTMGFLSCTNTHINTYYGFKQSNSTHHPPDETLIQDLVVHAKVFVMVQLHSSVGDIKIFGSFRKRFYFHSNESNFMYYNTRLQYCQ